MDIPELIIFDCDGVLIDSEPVASRTLALALQRAGITITAEESHIVFTGNAETDIRRICIERYGLADVEAVFARWHEDLYAEFAVSLRPMAGMLDLVSNLKAAKCVASNSGFARLEASLGRTALWPFFSPNIFSAEAVARPKPAPDLLLHCAEAFSATPARCVMIDDSPHGITSALAAGMVPIGFVDVNDPRPGRTDILASAGAAYVAVGAGELSDILGLLDSEQFPARMAAFQS
ncbi:HAD family hydrolase [Pelagibacterium mangrovi]|uniref:HAD family hydrolase n=1 Tax=Pelagibacterium mangrovi TaxID=3119828 RepID=UPI002FCC3EDC